MDNRLAPIILNFHGVGRISRSLEDGEHEYWLGVSFFEAVLDLVRGHSHVQLTFDDGNSSDFEIVLPALLKRGLQAKFFICSGRVDQPAFLTRAQLRELQAHNMGIGSHGITHVSWRRLSPRLLTEELEGSRRALSEICGCPVDTAACPYGAYDGLVLQSLRRAGYQRLYTSDKGYSVANDWIQPRTTVERSMTPEKIQCLIDKGPGYWEQSRINFVRLVKCLR